MLEQIRSFIAFDLDNSDVVKKLSESQVTLAKTGADLKVVEPKNIHITIRFLGNVTQDTVERIFDCMNKVQFAPFDVKICGIGAFPDVRYPRVVWAGITRGADTLQEIFHQLEPQLRSLGFAPDPKGFSPHLTIARVRSGRNKSELARFIGENSNYDFGVVRAACLRLKKSVLTPSGPIYSTLKEVCKQA
jgi:2'-5' RNA ligase